MSSMTTEIRACLLANLETGLDVSLASAGFHRRRNALVYSRKVDEAAQKIEISLQIHPADDRNSAAAVYPWLQITIDSVEKLVMKMVGGDESLLSATGITLRQPIEFTSAKKAPGRWFVYQSDSVPGVVGEMKAFIETWTLPFLNVYLNPAGMCETYDRGDERLLKDLPQALRIAAAMLICNRPADSLGVMNRSFGRPGPRERYKPVFDYLAARQW